MPTMGSTGVVLIGVVIAVGVVGIVVPVFPGLSLMVDYEIDFVKKNGTTKAKVFKLRQIQMAKGEIATLEKTHRLKKDASTFTLYPGTQKVSLKINGQLFPGTTFTLTE